MDLISIIVPVYNVEKYLDRCVQSIVEQNYRNLEIILVDDGSPDNCPAMCDAWAEKDSRIRVIHKENGGLSDARNVGLDVARGEYIAFVDSDDWVDANYLSLMYRAIQDSSAQISACDFHIVSEEDSISVAPIPISRNISFCTCAPSHAVADLLHGVGFRATAWNKLYHRSLLLNERYPIGKYHEDEFFTYRILAKAERLVYVEAKLYFYIQREGSIMHSMSEKRLDTLDAYLERLEFIKDRFPNFYLQEKVTFCTSCASFYSQLNLFPKDQQISVKERIHTCRAKISFSLRELKLLTPKQLLYVCGTGYCIELLCRLLTMRNRGTIND